MCIVIFLCVNPTIYGSVISNGPVSLFSAHTIL